MTTIRIPSDLADMLRMIRIKLKIATITEVFDLCTRNGISDVYESLQHDKRPTGAKRRA